MAIEADLEASAWEGEGVTARSGSATCQPRHPCFPQAIAPGDGARTTCSRPIAAAPCRKPRCPDHHPCPHDVGHARRAVMISRWTTAGAFPPRALATAVRWDHASQATASAALTADHHGACEETVCQSTAGNARGLALRISRPRRDPSDHVTNSRTGAKLIERAVEKATSHQRRRRELEGFDPKETRSFGRIYRSISRRRQRRQPGFGQWTIWKRLPGSPAQLVSWHTAMHLAFADARNWSAVKSTNDDSGRLARDGTSSPRPWSVSRLRQTWHYGSKVIVETADFASSMVLQPST